MKTISNIPYLNDLCLDIHLPEQKNFKTIVHFHGGGLVEGDKTDPYPLFEVLVSLGYCVVSVNYSMYPNVKFPQYLFEAAAAVKYVKENIFSYGGTSDIYVGGQSAGAWIALMLCFNHEYLDSVGVKNSDIKGWISDAAQTTSHFNILEIEKKCNPWIQRIDETAPIYYVDENVNFSRILLFTYTNDLPNRVEQNDLFVSAIKYFNKDADITHITLEGGHCSGTCFKNEKGEFAAIKHFQKWMKN